MSTFTRPPLDGSLDLLQIIQYNASHSPQHPVFRYSEGNNQNRDIVWSEAVPAFHRVAQKILQQHPTQPDKRPVIGIIGSVDTITYFSIVVGIMLAGCVPFPISPRNTPMAVSELLLVTDCKWVLTSNDLATKDVIAALLNNKTLSDLTVQPMPPFADLFSPSQNDVSLPVCHPDSTCIILHSSGTTSTPKPIHMSYKMMFEHGLQPCYGEVDLNGHMFSAQAVPMFHMMGIISIPWTAMLGLSIAVFSPMTRAIVPSPEVVLTNSISTHCTILYCVPTFLEEWARKESNIKTLKSFTAIFYAGGPLTTSVGDRLVREGINIAPMFGLTEIGAASLVVPARPPKEGWEWLRVAPRLDLVFVPEPGAEGVFRMVVKASQYKTPAVINTTLDGMPAYDTSDLVVRHPHNKALWKFYGRHDDQITHSTGTNPVPIESLLMHDANISSAVVFGQKKFQPGVLILPASQHSIGVDDPKALAAYRHLIWDTVTKVNKTIPQHSRIFKELIIVARPDKPFEFTGKGTPKRQAVLNRYKEEIENAYKAYDDMAFPDVPTLFSPDFQTTLQSVRTIVHRVLERPIEDSQDIFLAGGDSLCAVAIRNTIISHLRQSKRVPVSHIRKIPYDFVYLFSTISSLAAFIFGWSLSSEGSSEEDQASAHGTANNGILEASRGIQKPISKNEVVVEIQSGVSPPLIILPGQGGRAQPVALMGPMSTALWGVQLTESCPSESLEGIAEFFIKKIKEKQPRGPYRIVGYSGTSLLSVCMVKLLERQGDEVAQFAIIDHFPTLFLRGIDPKNSPLASEENWEAYYKGSLRVVAEGMANTDTQGAHVSSDVRRLGEELRDFVTGVRTTDAVRAYDRNARILTRATVSFLLAKPFCSAQGIWSERLFCDWMRDVRAPFEIYVAAKGIGEIAGLNPEERIDLGARKVYADARVVPIGGGHWSCMWEEGLSRGLSEGFGL